MNGLTKSFQSSTGYSSHFHKPVRFARHTGYDRPYRRGVRLLTRLHWLVSAEVEKGPRIGNNRTRVLLGLNPLHLTWPLAPGQTFTTPEVVCHLRADTRPWRYEPIVPQPLSSSPVPGPNGRSRSGLYW